MPMDFRLPNAADKVVEVLKSGGVVLCPTDTVYGLLCDAGNANAVKKIYDIKLRSTAKKLSLFVPSVDYISNLCEFGKAEHSVLTKFLPGRFTFVLNGKPSAISSLKWLDAYSEKSIGVRIPDSDFILQILNKFNGAIASTSANISGFADTSIYQNIASEVKNIVDLAVYDEIQRENSASSVIDMRDFGNSCRYTILRYTKFAKDFIAYVNKISGKGDLIKLKNIGIKMQEAMHAVGIYNEESFRSLGPAEVYHMLSRHNSFYKHKMVLYALYGAVFGINCIKLPDEIKKMAILESGIEN